MTISDFFYNAFHYTTISGSETPSVPLEEGAFPAFLKVDISKNKFEVPVPLIPYVHSAKIRECNQLVFNLVHGCDNMGRRTFHKKTINTILTEFYNASRNNIRIAHVVSSKNIHYYGCSGMILNADYEPLMINTLEVEWNPIGLYISNVLNPKCHLSYKVFENTEIVEKTLIKQMIPFYSTHGVTLSNMIENVPVEIVIEHTDSMIVKPSTPTPMRDSAFFNDTIVNHYDTVGIL